MLKHCLRNVDYTQVHAKQHLRPKCGEIFYESERSFQLVCYLCGMKHFSFEDFARHIQNVHLDSHGKPLTHTVTATHDATNSTADDDEDFKETPPVLVVNVEDNYNGNEFLSDAENNADDMEDSQPLRVISFKSQSIGAQQPSVNQTDSETDLEDADEAAVDALDTSGSQIDEAQQQRIFKKQRQPKEYKCDYCSRNYTTHKYLKMHIKMSHPFPNGFKCSECEATFDVERALDSHRRKLHTEFACKLCTKVYKSARTLLRHVQGHSGLRQFKCDFENCGKSFVNQHNLTSHRRVHSMERNYICELCGYRSRYREALVVHRRTHTGEKPFKCETCERCFASKSLLNEHQAMHSTERPYKCDKCEATFSRPKALYHHKHLHLGIKKFKCKICGNAYAQAAGLSAHMRSHKIQATNGVLDNERH